MKEIKVYLFTEDEATETITGVYTFRLSRDSGNSFALRTLFPITTDHQCQHCLYARLCIQFHR